MHTMHRVMVLGAAGYSGVGPAFLPWVIAAAFALCGVLLLVQASRGGYRQMPDPPEHPAYWKGMVWVSARGFRESMGIAKPGIAGFVHDLLVGAAISAPVYWLFTKLLGLTLPGITSTGWL